jgi:hypothetical protein
MSRISNHAITFCLIGTGALVWTFAGRPLATHPDLAIPLNPMGINGSPYGEVFAMALQGPIETFFHGSMGTGVKYQIEGRKSKLTGLDLLTRPEFKQRKAKAEAAKPEPKIPLGQRFEAYLASMNELSSVSTNPRGASQAHKTYLRRQAEDKLRFAYRLDPSHYGNYNSLNFFLTEPGIGSTRVLTPEAIKLSEETIQYCLAKEHDPRPALTAASAATNMIHLMFADLHSGGPPKFTTDQMRKYLGLLDLSIRRYQSQSDEWKRTGNWNLISLQRITECEDRFSFICKIRDAAEKTILRLEGKYQPQAAK